MAEYKDAGVDIEEGYKAVALMKAHAAKTFIPGVLNSLGSFAGMFELTGYKNPVLLAGTDGVGTKLKIAFARKRYDTVGIDCVAMSVNDVLCHGGKPLFFLDYLACGQLDGETAAQIVKGVSQGCIEAGCALIGGETAEMPGFYQAGEYDIAGFCLGVAEKDRIIDGSQIQAGDSLIGIGSSGLHSNGFSLVRQLITDLEMDFHGEKIGDVLLTPTRIYVKLVQDLMEKHQIKGMAHITGGGFYENIPRMFRQDLTAVIYRDRLVIPPIFQYLMELGVSEEEMFRTFNMGIGFVLCVDAAEAGPIISDIRAAGIMACEMGSVAEEGSGVCFR